jgi:hypothetical protein
MRIDDDIPIPQHHGDKGISATLRRLKKGQSAFFQDKTAGDMGGFIDHCGLSGKVTRRTIDGGCRVWRIK